jgi:hypothetical protein
VRDPARGGEGRREGRQRGTEGAEGGGGPGEVGAKGAEVGEQAAGEGRVARAGDVNAAARGAGDGEGVVLGCVGRRRRLEGEQEGRMQGRVQAPPDEGEQRRRSGRLGRQAVGRCRDRRLGRRPGRRRDSRDGSEHDHCNRPKEHRSRQRATTSQDGSEGRPRRRREGAHVSTVVIGIFVAHEGRPSISSSHSLTAP